MKVKNLKLDKEEKEILEAIDNDEAVSVGINKTELQALQEIARNTMAKTRTISIRIPERDLLRIKAVAAQEGMPYQTFISSTLHKKVREYTV